MPFDPFIDPLLSSLAFLRLEFSRNKIEHVIDPADTSLSERSGLRYYLELLVPEFAGSNTFERLVKMPGAEKPPVSGGGSVVFEGAFFQLDELLDGFLEYQKPTPGAVDMSIISTLTMPYTAKETVENNGVLLGASSKTLPNKWILKAGLGERDFTDWGTAFFTDYMSQQRPFLTWQADGKQVSQNQEEFLYFLLNFQPTPATFIRRARITYLDGAVSVIDTGQLTGGQAYQVLCVPAGPGAVLPPGHVGNVAKYEVWLSDQYYNRVSQVRTYQVDHRERSQERWILFTNSLGGWDTLRLLGEGSETLTTQRTVAELERPAGAAADFAELRVIYLQGSRSLTVSTGYFESRAKEKLRYLDELMLAKEIYLVDERGHQALELTTSSLVDKEDNQDLLARSFSFRLVTPEFNFSVMPAAPDAPARLVKWRGVGVVHILDGNGKRTGKGRPLKLQKYYPDDGSIFKPVTEKPNQPGDPDFIEPLPLPGITPGSTPYPSAALSRATTFVRTTCTGGQVGEAATVVVPAGKYGSEMSQSEADSRAESEYSLANNQAYADQYGSCTAAPELYQYAVPGGQWHWRVSDGQRFEIEWYDDASGEPKIGNTWDLQGQSRAFVYPRYSNDLNFPLKPSAYNWRYLVYGPAGSQVRVQVWQNGTLRLDTTANINQDGYEYFSLGGILTLASQDKLYLKATTL